MTIKEFYEWAIAHEVENAEIAITGYDEEGNPLGYDWLVKEGITIKEEGAVVEI